MTEKPALRWLTSEMIAADLVAASKAEVAARIVYTEAGELVAGLEALTFIRECVDVLGVRRVLRTVDKGRVHTVHIELVDGGTFACTHWRLAEAAKGCARSAGLSMPEHAVSFTDVVEEIKATNFSVDGPALLAQLTEEDALEEVPS